MAIAGKKEELLFGQPSGANGPYVCHMFREDRVAVEAVIKNCSANLSSCDVVVPQRCIQVVLIAVKLLSSCFAVVVRLR